MARHLFVGCGRFKFDLALITVEPVLFLYMLANFLYFPTLQALIFDKVCLDSHSSAFCKSLLKNKTFKDEHKQESDHVSAETSYWILKVNISLTVPAVVVVLLFLGVLGDKFGRKVPVLLPCFGAFAACMSALMNAYYSQASLHYILIGPIINGLCGGFIACLMSVYSYLGHIARPENKMKRVGIAEAMVFLAGTLGVFLSGVMLDNQGYVFVFSFSTIVNALAFFYTLFWLDNILVPSIAMPDGRVLTKIWNITKESFQCIQRARESHVLAAIVIQILVLDVLMLCTAGDMDISLLYLRDRLTFSQSLYGYLKGLDNFMRGITLLVFLPLVKRFTSVNDLSLVLFGLVSYAAAFIVTGIASANWMVFLACIIGMFKGIPAAGLRATMSSMVSTDEQGRLFGQIAASESVTTLISTVLFNELYPLTKKVYPGLCYLVAAGLIVFVFFFILYLRCTLPEQREDEDYAVLNEDVNSDDDELIDP